VRANAEPITRTLDAANIRYVIVGMNNLFSTAEAEAARQLFYFMADRPTIDADVLKQIWMNAGFGLNENDVSLAIATVTKSRCPLALTLRTANPFSSLKKVTRSISPERLSANGVRGFGCKRALGWEPTAASVAYQ
jgi:hypothetical protein